MGRKPARAPKAPMLDRRDYGDLFNPPPEPVHVRGTDRTSELLTELPDENGIFLVHNHSMRLHAETLLGRDRGITHGVRVWVVTDRFSLYRFYGLRRGVVVRADHELKRLCSSEMLSMIDLIEAGSRLDSHGVPKQ